MMTTSRSVLLFCLAAPAPAVRLETDVDSRAPTQAKVEEHPQGHDDVESNMKAVMAYRGQFPLLDSEFAAVQLAAGDLTQSLPRIFSINKDDKAIEEAEAMGAANQAAALFVAYKLLQNYASLLHQDFNIDGIKDAYTTQTFIVYASRTLSIGSLLFDLQRGMNLCRDVCERALTFAQVNGKYSEENVDALISTASEHKSPAVTAIALFLGVRAQLEQLVADTGAWDCFDDHGMDLQSYIDDWNDHLLDIADGKEQSARWNPDKATATKCLQCIADDIQKTNDQVYDWQHKSPDTNAPLEKNDPLPPTIEQPTGDYDPKTI